MKKWIVFPVALALITGLMLTGCGGDDPPPPGQNPAANGYTVRAGDGTLHKQDTSYILFTFDSTVGRGGLLLEDIEVTDGTGSITAVDLTDSPGPTRSMGITVEGEGNVKIKITKEGFSSAEKTVEVYKKLGFQAATDVAMSDIVKFGAPAAATGITFARFDGDPMAIVPPATRTATANVTTAAPAIDQEIATFSTPADLTEIAGTRELRWFDMVWDGFGYSWKNTSDEDRFLHQITFQLDLTNEDDQRIRLEKKIEFDVTSGKMPVRFIKADIQTGIGNTAWGTGHKIKAIALRVIQIQLRNEGNTAWTTPNTANPAEFTDLYLISLDVDTQPPSTPKVLYSSTGGGWDSMITNPKWGYGDAAFTEAGVNDGTTLPQFNGLNDQQKIVYFDPIDLTALADKAPYTTLVVTHTGGAMGYWNGLGIISVNPAWVEIADDGRVKLQSFGGSGGSPQRLPLDTGPYDGAASAKYFNPETFMGFMLQWNGTGSNNPLTITEIRLE
jgi:hypothetical protein